jgi:Flp pilus assembly protein TadB
MTIMTEHIQPLLETKRIPAALVAAFLLQTAGALFWAGSAAERITVLENRADANQTAIEKVAVLEERSRTMQQSLDRIEAKLDRMNDAKLARSSQ